MISVAPIIQPYMEIVVDLQKTVLLVEGAFEGQRKGLHLESSDR